MGSYTLEIQAIGIYITNAPVLEIWEDGVLDSSTSISLLGTTISATINYPGSVPTSLDLRFNDGFGGGRSIVIQSVKINDKYVNIGNFLSVDVLTQGQTANIDVAGSGFIFNATDPTVGDFAGATDVLDGTNNTLRDYDGAVHIVDAQGGRDIVYLGDGDDKVDGGAGDDVIRGGDGADLLFGNTGNDRVYGEGGDDLIYGGDDDDRLFGDEGNDEVHGGAGDDRVNGGDGNDILTGGDGDDILGGGDGDDYMFGGADNDQMIGGNGDDTMDGGDGNDLLYGGNGADIMNGGDGSDVIVGDMGDDILRGDDGDDTLLGKADDDELYGGEGNDTLNGGAGNDVIDGGNGTDTVVYGNAGSAVTVDLLAGTATGGDGADTITQVENIMGSDYNDTLTGNDGVNVINAGDGNDTVYGGLGDDVLNGNDGNDTIYAHLGAGVNVAGILAANAGVVYNADTNSFYKHVNSTTTWTSANATAQAATLTGFSGSGHLVTITSAAENTYVTGLISGNTWMSGTDMASHTDWVWTGGVEDGVQFSSGASSVNGMYENWAAGQPQDNTEHGSVLQTTGEWHDWPQTANHRYVIEWDAGFTGNDNAADTLNGGDGNDTLYGYGGGDILNGDAGDDVLFAGTAVASSALLSTAFDADEDGWTYADGAPWGGSDGANIAIDGNYIAGDGDTANGSIEVTFANTGVSSNSSGSYSIIVNLATALTSGQLSFSYKMQLDVGADAGENIYAYADIDGTQYGTGGNDYVDIIEGNISEGTYAWKTVTLDVGALSAGNHTITLGALYNQATAGDEDGYVRFDDVSLIDTVGVSNTLNGGEDDDILYGGSGVDILNGGDDDDVLYGDGISVPTVSSTQGWSFQYYNLGSSPDTLDEAGFTLNGGRDNNLISTSSGITQDTNPDVFDTGDNYALKFETTLTITTGGTYRFRTSSDDGSELFLDGVRIVDNGGLHGTETVTSSGQALSAGTYTLEAVFFEKTGGNVMDISMRGPDTSNAYVNLENYAGANVVTYSGSGSDGDDIINGGAGVDTLYGGGGADTFIFEAASAFADTDTIMDFSPGDGDILDISDIITGAFSGNIKNYVQFTSDGGDTLVQVDANGTAGGTSFQTIARIDGLVGLDEATLYANGNIIV